MIDEHYTPEPGEPWADDELLPAEKLLLAATKVRGKAKIRTDLSLPADGPWEDCEKTHEIRAELIRHLLVHPDAYLLDPMGFAILGAYIVGILDLENLKLEHRLSFESCLFENPPLLRHARTRTLAFHACRLPGLDADSLRVEGDLFLRQSVCDGEVRLLGVKVNGSVNCTNMIISNKDHSAFIADRILVKGNLTLNRASITGATRLLGANISGSLECVNASFSNAIGDAFNAQRMCVKESWFWELKTPIKGGLELSQASVGDFVDNGTGWPIKGKLYIDGFRYENLIRPTTAQQRIRWLNLMPKIGLDQKPIFYPQPYEQLIKVFKAAGHEHDARDVAIAKQDALYDHLKRQAEFDNVTTWHRRLWLLFLKYSAGYGYKPSYALTFSFGIMLVGSVVFDNAYVSREMLPAKELAYIHKCYSAVDIDPSCSSYWREQELESYFLMSSPTVDYPNYPRHIPWQKIRVPNDYVTFNPIAYSVDVFIPILDLQQETSWMPKNSGFRAYLWFHIIAGWLFTTIAVAGFSGLIKKEDK